jgi:hypothetical protein
MKRLVALFLLLPMVSLAQTPYVTLIPELKLRTQFAPQAVQVLGRPGVWFPNDDAEYLLRLRVDTVPSLYNTVVAQDMLIQEYRERVRLSDNLFGLEHQRGISLEKANQDANQALQKCLGDRAWYQSNTFMVSAGFVVGMLVMGGAVWLGRQ